MTLMDIYIGLLSRRATRGQQIDYLRQMKLKAGLLISVSGRMLFVIQQLSQREVRTYYTRR